MYGNSSEKRRVRYQVKSNDNSFVRWTEETDDTSQREHYDTWSDLDIYHEYNIESSNFWEEISKVSPWF